MKLLLGLLFFLASTCCWSQREAGRIEFINPTTVATARGYSHAAVVDLGTCKMLIISGQVALDSTGKLVGKDNLQLQTEQVFLNIKNIIIAAGGTMDDLAKVGIFMTDVSQIQLVRTVRDQYVNTKHPPASTLVQVSKLFRDDILIEIEATVIIPRK